VRNEHSSTPPSFQHVPIVATVVRLLLRSCLPSARLTYDNNTVPPLADLTNSRRAWRVPLSFDPLSCADDLYLACRSDDSCPTVGGVVNMRSAKNQCQSHLGQGAKPPQVPQIALPNMIKASEHDSNKFGQQRTTQARRQLVRDTCARRDINVVKCASVAHCPHAG